MIKQRNKEHSDLLTSFHIEIMAIRTFDAVIDDYAWGVFQYFDRAVRLASTALTYDGGYADDHLDSFRRRKW
jgi:hypothetical protein